MLFEAGLLLVLLAAYPSVVHAMFLVPIALAMIAYTRGMMDRIRVKETPDGLIIRNPGFGYTRVVPWAEVDQFVPLRAHGVGARRLDGSVTFIPGLAARETMTWDGGQTHDIVSELNARLAYWTRLDDRDARSAPPQPDP